MKIRCFIMSEEDEFKRHRFNAPIEYEQALRQLWGDRPMDYQNWMDLPEPRGGADGYAEADMWRLESDKIRDVDIGFIKAFTAIAHQLSYLRHRINELEQQIAELAS